MPLSVLQIASGFPGWGGTELHILNLSEQLRLRGHDVTIACRPGRWVEERAQKMGLPTVPLAVMKQNDWRAFGPARRLLRDLKPDVMHVHWSLDVVVPGWAAKLEGVPVRIMSRHMPYPFKNKLGARLYSSLYSRMTPVSNSVRETMILSGAVADKIEVIHHGTDVAAFEKTTRGGREVRAELGVPDDCVAVGIAGRIAPEKGHRILLEAAKRLDGRYPLRFVVIGDGPDETAMRALADTLGIADSVVWAGFRADINDVLAALDIVVVPSTWPEPCSAVVQQGMAVSRPVVGTRTGGTPEMIVDEETGLLVAPGDADALAAALARLAGDAFVRRCMGRAGRVRVEEQFSLRVMTDKIEALYRREYDLARGPTLPRQALAS